MAADLDAAPEGRALPRELILASRSPQRQAILEQLGVSFSVVVSGVEEVEEGSAEDVAIENARRKAAAVAERRPDALVLAADTVVCLEGQIYGKPADRTAAERMLRALSGRRHTVTGGICLIEAGSYRTRLCTTSVRFRGLDDGLVAWYLDSEEWRQRAGGYAIQGHGTALVAGIEGDYFNVVGLSVATLLDLLPGLVG